MSVEYPFRAQSVSDGGSRVGWAALLLEGVVFFGLTVLGAYWARLLTTHVLDFSPIWPPAGLAIAAAIHRPRLLWPIGLGLVCWSSLLHGSSIGFAIANTLTLTGALFYRWAHRRMAPALESASALRRLQVTYGLLFIAAILPDSVIGSLLYTFPTPLGQFANTLLVYVIGETAGVAVFAPVGAVLLGALSVRAHLSRRGALFYLFLTAAAALLPLFLYLAGRPDYAQGSYMLVFPFVAWVAVQNRRGPMALALAVIAVTQLQFESWGIGLAPPTSVFDFVQRVLWILAAYIVADLLAAYSQERQVAFNEARWQATHHENTRWLNERGLQGLLGALTGPRYDLVLAQACQRDLIMASLSYEELLVAERRLCDVLQRLHAWEAKARLSDLTYAFLVRREEPLPLGSEQFQRASIEGMNVRLDLGWGRVPVRLNDAGYDTLAEGYATLKLAHAEPLIRVHELLEKDGSVADKNSHFGDYHRIVHALEQGGLRLFGQPIRHARGQAPSVEILARLALSDDELANPGWFTEVLRAFDGLEILDRAVIRAAVANQGPLESLLERFGRVNINLSGSTLCDPTFLDWLTDIWPEHLPRRRVCLELTESELIRDWTLAMQVVQKLREMGFLTAIDDFGSGMASYEYLEHFPVDLIKLDGLFVRDLPDNAVHCAMVKATVKIARSLGTEVCAEFVSSDEAIEFLSREGVDYLQGFHIARPEPVKELIRAYPGKDFQNVNPI